MTTVEAARDPVVPARARRTNGPAAVLGAMVLLVLVYGILSLANDPRGDLGSDTGGKLATLATMDANGSFDPDVGYWAAEYDPTGALHPLYYTTLVGSRWVNITTVPMVLAARPLYALGGPRAVLLLPMLGAAFSALAARALAQRVGGGSGWFAFWAVGLASPVAIYALDFWEHSLGLAFALWGVVLAFDLVDGRAGWKGALASGVCFGAAATMRTDVLVYAAVTALVMVWILGRAAWRAGLVPWGANLRSGLAWAVGLATPLVANEMLERAVMGGGIRAGRASGTARAAGSDLSLRLSESFTTAVGLNRFEPHTDQIFGALTALLVGYGAWRLTEPSRRGRLAGGAALGAAVLLYALRFEPGWGFVPGVLTASPLAAAGLVIGWSARRWRMPGAIALLAVPLVWVFQYSGGAAPQWGGRYLLVTSSLLAVGAAVVLAATPGVARWAVVGVAALVTAGGLLWLSQLSHSIADAMRALPQDPDTVLVSRERHFLRAGGAFYTPDSRWLTAPGADQLRAAAAIAAEVDAPRLTVMAGAGRGAARRLGEYQRVGRRTVEFAPGVPVDLITYRRQNAG